MKRQRITVGAAIAVNLFVGLMSFGAWLMMALKAGDAAQLANRGFSSLKFFTVLSNLLSGGVSLCYVAWLLGGRPITPAKKTLKLVSTAAVGLTFITVMVFLGPLYGFRQMLQGANFWLHLVLPLLSFGSFLVLERGTKIRLRNTLWAMASPGIYGTVYVLNIVVNGKGEWPNTNDFYGFLNWGNGIGAVVAVAVLLVTWGIALVLWRLGGARPETVSA